jgi:hypothetical protein
VISHAACDRVGVVVGPVAALLGAGGPVLTVARRRGRSILIERGWTIDDVLSWTGGDR